MRSSGSLRTPDEVKAELADCGISISSWARANDYSPELIRQILTGRIQCLRGQSHNAAIDLGLKIGKKVNVNDMKFSVIDNEKGGDQMKDPSKEKQ